MIQKAFRVSQLGQTSLQSKTFGKLRSWLQLKPKALIQTRLRSLSIAVAALLCSAADAQDIPDCGLYAYAAKVTRVVDGDTIVADVDLGFHTWRHDERLRLAGIQTPERGAEGYDEATEALADKIAGRDVFICTVKAAQSDNEVRGGYGRYLATVYFEGVNINEWLLEEGHAVNYE